MLLLVSLACSKASGPCPCDCATEPSVVCIDETVVLPDLPREPGGRSDPGRAPVRAAWVDTYDEGWEDAHARFEVPEGCEGGSRIAYYDLARALDTVRLVPRRGGEVSTSGTAQGRAHGVRVRLRKGQVLRLRDAGEDCPGVNVLGPQGNLAYEGLLKGPPVDVYVDETGDWEIDLLGYAGAHGNNPYDLRLSLVDAVPRVDPALYRRYDARYPHELTNVPGMRVAFMRALGDRHDAFWERAGTQSPMRLVRDRWLVGSGCIPESCPDGGGWFVVDATDGRITAGTYRNDSHFLLEGMDPVAGRLEDIPDDVQEVVREEIR
jgi:hypothetical protein